MWVEFTWGNSNAFPTSFHFLHALEKELNFGSPTDENCYNGERGGRLDGNLKSNKLKILWLLLQKTCRYLEIVYIR